MQALKCTKSCSDEDIYMSATRCKS